MARKSSKQFFAVTESKSIYRVYGVYGISRPIVVKVHGKGKGHVRVGARLKNGSMLAISRNLQLYVPEGSGLLSPMSTVERSLEMVNTRYWGGHTSPIVALCRTKTEATEILKYDDLQMCDRRWVEQTRKIVNSIPEDHPSISVCRYPSLALLPEDRGDV